MAASEKIMIPRKSQPLALPVIDVHFILLYLAFIVVDAAHSRVKMVDIFQLITLNPYNQCSVLVRPTDNNVHDVL